MRADIQERLIALRATPSEQLHALVTIKNFLTLAGREELIEANPIGSMKALSKRTSRERVLSLEELRAVYHAAQSHAWPFGPIVQLLILTGQRRVEVGVSRWQWIDETERMIHCKLKPPRTATGTVFRTVTRHNASLPTCRASEIV